MKCFCSIRGSLFFIWRFAYPGDYLLTVQVTDVNNNVYELTKGFNAVDALDQKDYINHIENTLNRRNASM
jgi:hypothetical protein